MQLLTLQSRWHSCRMNSRNFQMQMLENSMPQRIPRPRLSLALMHLKSCQMQKRDRSTPSRIRQQRLSSRLKRRQSFQMQRPDCWKLLRTHPLRLN
jgi:hypothetical protein